MAGRGYVKYIVAELVHSCYVDGTNPSVSWKTHAILESDM